MTFIAKKNKQKKKTKKKNSQTIEETKQNSV